MRHSQRALFILVERLFLQEETVTEEEQQELDCLNLSAGEVREVFRTFLRGTFADDELSFYERRRLLAIAHRLHLPEELVPAVTLRAA